MRPCSICLSASCWFHLTRCTWPWSKMLLKQDFIHCTKEEQSIAFIYQSFFMHSSHHERWGRTCILVRGRELWWTCEADVSDTHWCHLPWPHVQHQVSWITWHFVVSFWGNPHSGFLYSGHTHLHSHHQHSYKHVLFLVFLSVVISAGLKWCIVVVCRFISPVISGVCLFKCTWWKLVNLLLRNVSLPMFIDVTV